MEKKKGIENLKKIFAFGAEFMDVITKGIKDKDWMAMSELVDEAIDISHAEWKELRPEVMDLDSQERKELENIIKSKIENADEDLEVMIEAIAMWALTTVDAAMAFVEYKNKKKEA